MCVFVKSKTPKIAQEDITCWKVLYSWSGNTFFTPYFHADVRFDEEMADDSHPYIDDSLGCSTDEFVKVYPYFVERGFYHMYKNEDEALIDYGTDEYVEGIDLCHYIVKCIIPKGTAYFEGIYRYRSNGIRESVSRESFAAAKIILKKETLKQI